MIKIPGVMSFLPYLLGGAVLFIAGGELIGGYKVSKVMRQNEAVQQQLISNALTQAQELAHKWEEENAKARELRRRVDTLQGQLRSTSVALDSSVSLRQEQLRIAAENLSQCLLNEDTRRILNDWMTNENSIIPNRF